MAEWVFRSLGDIATLTMGQSPPGHLVRSLSDGLPFLQGNAEFGPHFPTATSQCDEAPRRSAPDDSLISVRAPVGAINRSDLEYGIGRGLAAVAFEAIDPDFGHHALAEHSRSLHRVAQGTTFSAIGRTELAELQFPVPPLEEQRRIAEVLDTIDETIQATQHIVAKLRRVQTGALYAVMEATVLTGRRSTVEKEFDIESGITLNASRVPRSNAIGYLRVANVQRNYIDTSDLAELETTEEEIARKKLLTGDLVLVEGHANPSEIGRCAVVTELAEGLLFQNHLFRLRSRSIPSEIAQLILNSEQAKAYWQRMCATSSGLYTINSSMLRKMPISIPDSHSQRVVSKTIETSNALISVQVSQLRKLQEVRAGLANDLLSGRVRTVAA